MPVLQLDDCTKEVYVRHDLMADAAGILQVVQEKQNDSHNLLLVEVIEDFHCSLDDHQVEVLEALQSELVVGRDPEGSDHVVSNLVVQGALAEAVLGAGVIQKLSEDVEATSCLELSRQFIGLQKIHEREGVGLPRDSGGISLLSQPVQELL